ncbi:hypothetical protein HK405_009649 [Cladochytrium tenue]|nr:hypothetical protein HK405_009649 [Cladochytrium tenue]
MAEANINSVVQARVSNALFSYHLMQLRKRSEANFYKSPRLIQRRDGDGTENAAESSAEGARRNPATVEDVPNNEVVAYRDEDLESTPTQDPPLLEMVYRNDGLELAPHRRPPLQGMAYRNKGLQSAPYQHPPLQRVS